MLLLLLDMTPMPSPSVNDQHTAINEMRDPLQVLPPELVGKIFQQWLQNELHPPSQFIYSQLPVILCSVSKSWRDFVYGYPLLWRHLVINATQGNVRNLRALENRMDRSQLLPLIMDISVGEHPDYDALHVIFLQCGRFHELTLGASDLSWWSKVPRGPFSLLTSFSVRTWMHPDLLLGQEGFNGIFATAPLLHHVKWHSPADPEPLCTKGSQLRSLDILAPRVPVMRILDVMKTCTNLRTVIIDVKTEDLMVMHPPREPITMGTLETLRLVGSKHLKYLFEGIRTPQLSSFSLRLARYDANLEPVFEALESFLVQCPMLQHLTLEEFIRDEEMLLRILDSHPRIKRLSVTASPCQKQLATDKLVKSLTFRTESSQKALLPLLEELTLSGGINVQDNVVMEMIQSRSSNLMGNNVHDEYQVHRSWTSRTAAIEQSSSLRYVNEAECG
ncbi:hypothetical protein ID866_7495 [Astraeus odoratus]|nr:hypothetical protein ID866_7495 [Astraeus odoratus]